MRRAQSTQVSRQVVDAPDRLSRTEVPGVLSEGQVPFSVRETEILKKIKSAEITRYKLEQQRKKIRRELDQINTQVKNHIPSNQKLRVGQSSIVKKTRKKHVKLSVGDVLDIVGHKFGKEKQTLVVRELERLHVADCPQGSEIRLSLNKNLFQ